ncbi:MAG: DUF3949 domain-containing protein, partial [Bacillota bacterium]|nr:DUF3949 domain-containing protein [Bacillota bacterium]
MVFFLILVIFYVLLSLILLPFQYRFLVSMKQQEKINRLKGKKQGELYDKMSVGELELQYNIQSNPLFLLANIFASVIYR